MEFSARPDYRFLELADALRQLSEADSGLFHQLLKDQGMSLRTGRYMVALDRALGCRKDISHDRLRRIGWTNLTVILPHLTDDNAEELLTLAEANKTRDLKVLVRDQKAPRHMHCVQLYFNDKDYRELSAALLQHGGRQSARGIAGKEAAIMKIVKTATSRRG